MNSKNPISLAGTFLFLLLSFFSQAQSFGSFASAVWITDCNQSNFFNTSGTGSNLIGPVGNVFQNANLGAHTQNSGTLILRGAEVKTFKNPASSNVCSVRLNYRVYPLGNPSGTFSVIDIPFLENCNAGAFPSGGPCNAGDQKWQRIIPTGATTPYAPVNLTGYAPGNYELEVYYELVGSNTTTNGCSDIAYDNNSGANYKATFAIQAPTVASNNPTSCNGTEGSVTINGLVPGVSYDITYTDNGNPVGPVTIVADGSGHAIISGLDAGVYAGFSIKVNGCTTNLFSGVILSNPILVPSFTAIPAFCAGTTATTLPTTSTNGLTGAWSPAVINNMASGSYTFTPDAGQCGLPVTINITVTPRITPTFSFPTSICAGATVSALPTTSNNGITGTWDKPISNTASDSYTFTPTAGLCATAATFTVTVNPNITPTFSFGTTLTTCSGGTVPALPTTSTNSITGTWSPATVSNTASGTYTFTPTVGQCATTTSLTVTVTPNTTPTFSFGTTLTICSGEAVPTLPTTSDNGVTGTWNPATVSNTASGTYTFTPTAGLCALPATFTVTVNPNITPTFSFGTTLTICAGGTVPALPAVSTNGINGSWSPAVVDDQNSGVYTFTPTAAGQCAVPTTFTVTVNPNITPTFSFGTTLTICSGGTVPALPTTSTNNITGTWSPATVSNTASGTYTFTPTAGLCATTTTFTVTVNPNITPTFSFGTTLTICSGGSVPTLPTTSDNGITGTWAATTVSNTASGTYTFTPTAGLCANTTTFTVTVNPNITPTFSFGTTLTICAGGAVPALPAASTNGINGTWSPAVVDDQNSGVYTFTPTAGQCALPATFTVTVNPNITPTFSFGTTLTICSGGTVPALPTTSENGITGTWAASTVSNTASAVYTFTPTAGLCATATTFTVTVNPNITPTFSFGTTLTICSGGSVPALPTTSDNGIAGTWAAATVSNTVSAVYTFTPTAGQCATTATFTVTVNPNITPTFSFGTTLTICSGGTVPSLPTTSSNGITGTWAASTVSNTASAVYTFTPTAGLCATTTTFTVAVNPNITPTFSFGTALAICSGGTVPALPTTSTNNITGTWSPATVSNTASGTYTFTPTAGQCAVPTTFTVTVDVNITPTFSFGTTLTICSGGSVPTLPTTSDNGITGTWAATTVSNTASAVYTFTPTAGLCATTTTFTVTVNPNITPTFNFGTTLSVCNGAAVPALPTTSTNGITGTWSPVTVSNTASGTYTFTPTAGLCAVPTTLTVTVNPILTPTFSFGTTLTICAGATAPTLTNTSTNGISGTWSPASVNNQADGVYTFTPNAGQCGTPTTFTVTVTPNTIPTFSFGTTLTICSGGTVPALPTTSVNGVTGTWNPSSASNTASGVYTFTPTSGICATTQTFTVTVNPIVTPTFSFGTSASICIGATVPALPTTSSNNITGTWSPAAVSTASSGTTVYTFTPTAGACATTTTYTVEVNPVPSVTAPANITVNDGVIVPATNFVTTPSTGVTISWTNSNTAIGLAASGTGNVPQFTATNTGNTDIAATITVTPRINGCIGTAVTYIITVKALNKDVFVPNVFSPNGDGKNEVLMVYGNYINKVEMRIFNQWGQQIAMINSRTQGWDGTHNGKPQPVGVYMYVLRAVMNDGRTIDLKGSITLVR